MARNYRKLELWQPRDRARAPFMTATSVDRNMLQRSDVGFGSRLSGPQVVAARPKYSQYQTNLTVRRNGRFVPTTVIGIRS